FGSSDSISGFTAPAAKNQPRSLFRRERAGGQCALSAVLLQVGHDGALLSTLTNSYSTVASSAPSPVLARTISSAKRDSASGSRRRKVPRIAPRNPSGILRIPGFSHGKIGGR